MPTKLPWSDANLEQVIIDFETEIEDEFGVGSEKAEAILGDPKAYGKRIGEYLEAPSDDSQVMVVSEDTADGRMFYVVVMDNPALIKRVFAGMGRVAKRWPRPPGRRPRRN